jgi:hypothetical protein
MILHIMCTTHCSNQIQLKLEHFLEASYRLYSSDQLNQQQDIASSYSWSFPISITPYNEHTYLVQEFPNVAEF